MEGQMQDVLAGQARWAVVCGDARSVLAGMADASVDAVVTDPPYALTDTQGGARGFMGAAWDNGRVAHDPAFWAEVLRVARPGAFLLAFGGTRTYHRLACAVEDAGWECRDMLNWLQGSGFPKSKSCLKPSHEPILLAKAPGPLQPLQIDATRVATGESLNGEAYAADKRKQGGIYGKLDYECGDYQQPPGRWPPNALFSHVGGPDGCQPAGVRCVRGAPRRANPEPSSALNGYGPGDAEGGSGAWHKSGAHYGGEQVDAWDCHPSCPVRLLDEQAGPRTSGSIALHHVRLTSKTKTCYGQRAAPPEERAGSTGGASRFFPAFAGAPDPEDAVPFRYEPKASRRDREGGLEAVPAVERSNGNKWTDQDYRVARGERTAGRESGPRRNTHPTCKPTALMAWLCKLVTPEDGLVLDCFGGSGSTGVAALRCGMRAIIIEQDAHYCDIARARIAHAREQQSGPLFAGIAAQR